MEHVHRKGGQQHRNGMMSSLPRWGAIVGGSALAVLGVTRRSKAGIVMAAAGGALAYGGVRMSPAPIHAEASFIVNVEPEEAYRFWLNLENLPKFMSHLESVRDLGNGRSEWVARGPMRMNIKWTAEIVDRRENQWLVWRSDPSSTLPNSGSVQFRRATGGRGTAVTVAMQYMPPTGAVGKAVAALFGKHPEHAVREDLRHFKQLIETGEIPTTEGQSHGPRSLKIKAKHAIYEDDRPKPVESMRPQPEPQEVAS